MSGKINYWLELADYDLETAKTMLLGGRYLYVGFMCHQTIEKSIKAVISKNCKQGEFPPKMHNLLKLADRARILSLLSSKQLAIIKDLNPLNIEARYPDYKDMLLNALTEKECKRLLTETEGLLKWIKEQL